MFGMPKSRKERVKDFFSSPEGEYFPLHAAICNEDLGKAQELVNLSPASIDKDDTPYGTPLSVAVYCDSFELVKLLLAAGADPLISPMNAEDPGSSLAVAARENKPAILRHLWNHMEAIETARNNYARLDCLLTAARWGRVSIVSLLLDWWDACTMETKEHVLDWAAQCWQIYVVERLLSRVKFDSKALDTTLASAISHRAQRSLNDIGTRREGVHYFEQQQLIKLLIFSGANVNTTCFGCPLLLLTFSTRDLIGASSVLLDNGVDPNTTDAQGKTALHHLGCPKPEYRRTSTHRIHEAGIRLLLGHQADVCRRDGSGSMPIHEAAYGTNLRIFLLELFTLQDQAKRDTALMSTNNYGTTLLHYAAAGAKLDTIEYLLSQGLDVNSVNANGWTPLMCALVPTSEGPLTDNMGKPKKISEAIETAQLLLAHGADASLITNEGWTPLHCLSLYVNKGEGREVSPMIADLISRGIDPNDRAVFPCKTGYGYHELPEYYWGYDLHEIVKEPENFENSVLRSGYTALHFAAAKGSLGVARALISHGADAASRDDDGNSAAKIATHSWYMECYPALRSELVELLKDAENLCGK
ncbi:hypothetical protein FGRMN_613 [Fusarium graminum]|nr:hypothetical protein FGRMN_613 [Fusarium graminum]